jgi:hypothetical protein
MEIGTGLHPKVDKVEGESNWEWCQRYAALVDKDAIIRALVQELQRRMKSTPQHAFSQATSHGQGVGSALAERFGFED